MDTNELKRQIGLIKAKEVENIELARRISRKNQQIALDNWAKSHAKFRIGDIICSRDVIIRIERISGRLAIENPYIEYYGPALTKQLKERKDGWITTIYDDNPDRNIYQIHEKI